MKIQDFLLKKRKGEKIIMVTAYDASMARILSQSDVDCLLVGDSAAMVVHGFESTIAATVDMMEIHTAAVARGSQSKKFIVADMPFLSVRKGLENAMNAVERLMRAGAHAVKIEGIRGQEEIISHIVKSGVPVMGHLGLMPQSIHATGGYKVQAKEKSQQEVLMQESKELQDLGCFSLVLECVPSLVATQVSEKLQIPTIGIGAGAETDGQVLVYHDLLGLNGSFRPKFLKTYLEGEQLQVAAFNHFCTEVKQGLFPTEKESYTA